MFDKFTLISAFNKRNYNYKTFYYTLNKIFCNAITISRKILIYSECDSSTPSIQCNRYFFNIFVILTQIKLCLHLVLI